MPRHSLWHGGNTDTLFNLRLQSERAPFQFAQSVGVQMRQSQRRGFEHKAKFVAQILR